VPTGGTTNQYLIKLSNADYDFGWGTPAAGIAWPLYAPDGTFSAPSYSFQNSQTTGIFRDGADAIGFSTNGLSRWRINASGHFVAPADNTYDIGAAGATRPRNIYAAGAHIGNGAVPTGGTSGQVLSKSSATDYALSWTTPFSQATADARYLQLSGGAMTGPITGSGTVPTGGTAGQVLSKIDATNYNLQWTTPATGVSWPLLAPTGAVGAPSYSFSADATTGLYYSAGVAISVAGANKLQIQSATSFLSTNLFFTPDNSFDIGATGASRPRDLFLSRNATITGTSTLVGNVTLSPGMAGFGATPSTSSAIFVGHTVLVGTTQNGIDIAPVFTSAATVAGNALRVQAKTAAASFTMANGYAVNVLTPSVGAGATVTTLYGINVANQGASGVTNAYGLYVNAQSGASTTNIGLYNAGTSQLQGNVGIGTAPQSDALYVQGTTQLRSPIGINTPPPTNPLWFDINGFTKLGYVGIGTTPPTDYSVAVQIGGTLSGSVVNGGNQLGINVITTYGTGATSSVKAIQAKVGTQSGAYTTPTAGVLWVDTPSIGAGNSVTNLYGLYVTNQGVSSVTNAYGIYINSQSGASSTNIGLYNGGTTQVMAALGIGAAPFVNTALTITPTFMQTASQSALFCSPTFSSATTTMGQVIVSQLGTAATTFTMTNGYGFFAAAPSLGAGSSINTLTGVYVQNQGRSGITNAYGLFIEAQSGASTSNIGLYINGPTGTGAWSIYVNGGSVLLGASGLPNSSATGHVSLPGMAGTPTGTPSTAGVPIVFDYTQSRLWAYYSSAWHYVQFT